MGCGHSKQPFNLIEHRACCTKQGLLSPTLKFSVMPFLILQQCSLILGKSSDEVGHYISQESASNSFIPCFRDWTSVFKLFRSWGLACAPCQNIWIICLWLLLQLPASVRAHLIGFLLTIGGWDLHSELLALSLLSPCQCGSLGSELAGGSRLSHFHSAF